MMFGFYIRNNIGVAFQCFAGGLFAGLGTVFFLAYNGAFSGALAGYLTERGLSRTFYSFVATHSAFELTAIVIAGTAGLRLGHALLAPGRLRRRVALVEASRDTVVLLYGVTAMLRAGRGGRGVLVVGQLAQPDRQVQRGGGVLGRRARLFRLPGPPCRLTPSPSGCGRARRSRPPISASACVRAPARSVSGCYALAAVPALLLAAASYQWASWLPGVVIWWLKPWLDQSILFVLSRAAFGQTTTPGDLWRARRQVWWRQLLFTLTVRRLSPWRSLTQPVYRLEGLSHPAGPRAGAADPPPRRRCRRCS